MKTYETWEEAAEKSAFGRAITSLVVTINNRPVKAELIKSKNKNGIIVYRHSAVQIREATTREVDSARSWKPL